MAKRLAKLKDCPECGKLMGHNDVGVCWACRKKISNEKMKELMEAAKRIDESNAWQKEFNPWLSMVMVPGAIILLGLVLIGLILLATMG